MYSRAERLFLMPDADHANPVLGPGTYNPDNVGQIWGKSTKKAGYAPFSSLSPRVSTFDAFNKYTPAPGAYEAPSLPFHRGDRSSFFGRSKATRFDSKIGDTPGPGSYVLPSSLKLRSNSMPNTASKLTAQSNFLTQQPVLVSESEVETLNINEIQANNERSNVVHIESAETDAKQNVLVPFSDADSKKILLVARQAQGFPSSGGSARRHATKGNRIIWKRKHVPPSIPIGKSTFGYTEDDDGELIPRKPPVAPQYREPSYLISFAEESRHSNRGYRFGKGQGRLTFKPHPGPGPNVYDIESPDQYLKQSARGAAAMALAPCKRVTDEIVSDAVKKGIPGPGAYEVKALSSKSSKQKSQSGFGGQGHKFITQLDNPGPGSYYPEYFENSKKLSHKASSFGSTTKRFENTTSKASAVPAPGSYELSEVYSLASSVEKKTKIGNSNPAIAFGSFTERFKSKVATSEPGPGQYDPGKNLEYEVFNAQSVQNQENNRAIKESKISSLVKKGPVNLKIGNVLLNAAQMHIPIFGTQAERFKESFNPVPPPGAYDAEKAFERLVNKGKIENISIMSSHQKQHDLPILNENTPGPGEYDPPPSKKPNYKSSFSSSIVRFPVAQDTRPGPGAYNVDNDSLHRKTFNVTLTEWPHKP